MKVIQMDNETFCQIMDKASKMTPEELEEYRMTQEWLQLVQEVVRGIFPKTEETILRKDSFKSISS